MKFIKSDVSILTEEKVYPSQRVAYFQVDSKEDVYFSLSSETSEYFSLVSGSQKDAYVYLTQKGVDAINADYPEDPSKEIKMLQFKIKAINEKTGSTATQIVNVSVIRVHDEPPKILSHYVFPTYTESVKVNDRILEVTATHDAVFSVTGEYSNYFYFDNTIIKTYGIMQVNANGVNFIKNNLKWEGSHVYKIGAFPAQDLEIPIHLIDKENNKETEATIRITIYKGNKDITLPTKNTFELMAEYLTETLGKEIGDLIVKNRENNDSIDRIKNKLTQIITKAFDNYLNIEDLEERLEEVFKRKKEADEYQNNYSNILLKDINDALVKDIFNEIKIYLQDNKNIDYQAIAKSSDVSYNGEALAKTSRLFTEIVGVYFYTWMKFWTEKKIVPTLSVLDDKINDLRDKINDNLKNIFSNYFTELTTVINNNLKNLKTTANNVLALDYRCHETEKYIGNHEKRIKHIEDYDLSDWDIEDGFRFSSNGNDLLYGNNNYKVLHTDDDIHTKLYGGTDHETYVEVQRNEIDFKLNNTGTTLKLTNAKLELIDSDTTTMKADVFDGTANKALYADVAENYLSDQDYEFGTIVSIETSEYKNNEITIYDKAKPLAGVISYQPGYILNSGLRAKPNTFTKLVALKGRVPVKSKTEIKKGHYVYADSKNPGYAYGSKDKLVAEDLIGVCIGTLIIDNKIYYEVKL